MLCDTTIRTYPQLRNQNHSQTTIQVLHLSLLAKSATQGTDNTTIAQKLHPRTQFHSSKLKDPATRKKFSNALEDQASKAEQAIQTFKTSLDQGCMKATHSTQKKPTQSLFPTHKSRHRKLFAQLNFEAKMPSKNA